VALTPGEVKSHLSDEQLALYTLIWTRFVASQMKPAEWEVTDLSVQAGPGLFKAVGRTLIYDGYTKLAGVRMAEGEQMLPRVEPGQAIALVELKPSQHSTQPPPRYSEATLIKKLESLGIGRPSTYANILSTIEDREYVEQEQRRYHATDLGKVVTDRLVADFPDILNVDFTRHMEGDLDKVETGEMDYVTVLNEFWAPFTVALEAAGKSVELPTDIVCDLCGKKMVVRASRRGPFMSCQGYPKCKNAQEPPPELVEKFNKLLAEVDPSSARAMPKETGRNCPQCGGPMVERMGRFGMFVGCKNYPKCKFIEKTKKAPPKGETTELPCTKCGKPLNKIKSRKGVVYFACSDHEACGVMVPAKDEQPQALPECVECHKPMTLRLSRGEPFLGCSGYPECKTTVSLGPKRSGKGGKGGARRGGGKAKMLKTTIACDKCGKMMVVRASRRGPFLACPGYPKCKNAKDASPELVEQFNALSAAAEAEAAKAAEPGGEEE
jgi:DNA topoisomerase-1